MNVDVLVQELQTTVQQLRRGHHERTPSDDEALARLLWHAAQVCVVCRSFQPRARLGAHPATLVRRATRLLLRRHWSTNATTR